MAKKKPMMQDIFAKTTETGKPARGADPITAKGVGLKDSEWAEIEKRAAELGMNRHALAVVLVRYGLAALREGRIKTRTTTQKTLDL